jgi:purine nucleoside phosphorylase
MALKDKTPAPTLGIIGGTGIEDLAGFELQQRLQPKTPFGAISGSILLGKLHGVDVALLNRHGLLKGETGQHIPPHAVNYRANIWALAQLSLKRVLAFNAVGGISTMWPPGQLGLPHDLIDYSHGRAHSYFDPDSALDYHHHVEMSEPFSAELGQLITAAAKAANISLQTSGVIGVTQGPRLETAAEIKRLAQDGCDLVGMTSMPEAALAAELQLQYSSLAFSVNWAAGKAPDAQQGIHDEIAATIEHCQTQLGQLLAQLVKRL